MNAYIEVPKFLRMEGSQVADLLRKGRDSDLFSMAEFIVKNHKNNPWFTAWAENVLKWDKFRRWSEGKVEISFTPKIGDLCYFYSAREALRVGPVLRLFRGLWKKDPRLLFLHDLLFRDDFIELWEDAYPMFLKRFPKDKPHLYRPHYTLFAALTLLRRFDARFEGSMVCKSLTEREIPMNEEWVCLTLEVKIEVKEALFTNLLGEAGVQAVIIGVDGSEYGHAYTWVNTKEGPKCVDFDPNFERGRILYACIWRLQSANQGAAGPPGLPPPVFQASARSKSPNENIPPAPQAPRPNQKAAAAPQAPALQAPAPQAPARSKSANIPPPTDKLENSLHLRF